VSLSRASFIDARLVASPIGAVSAPASAPILNQRMGRRVIGSVGSDGDALETKTAYDPEAVVPHDVLLLFSARETHGEHCLAIV